MADSVWVRLSRVRVLCSLCGVLAWAGCATGGRPEASDDIEAIVRAAMGRAASDPECVREAAEGISPDDREATVKLLRSVPNDHTFSADSMTALVEIVDCAVKP